MYKGKLEDVITFENYFRALKECNRNVNYKLSVQEYNATCVEKISNTINLILNGKIPNVSNSNQIVIFERGKKRIITPIDISDRITQKVLCDNVLVPAICKHLIYDNGASMKNKGTNFARDRVNTFIEKAKRTYGCENLYALVFDFKNYFDSIPHEQCYNVLNKYIEDARIVNLIIGIIESYKLKEINLITDACERQAAIEKLRSHKCVGICLGSQISQIMAVAVPNEFDHYIKDVKRFKFYERYMDDGIIIHNSKDELLKLKLELERAASKYGLFFNKKKTYITKLSKGFTFLKIKYNITKDGKTSKRLVHSGIVRERRRLKKYKEKVDLGYMSYEDVYNNIQSWNAHSKIAKCHTTCRSMYMLYDNYFGGYKMTRKYYRNNPNIHRKKKVTRL